MKLKGTEGLYYHPQNNNLLHWEPGLVNFKGKSAKSFGIAWMEGWDGRFLGTPLEQEAFILKMLEGGFVYIGKVK